MASNDSFEEKPNLRPTKRQSAGGKTIFLHHNPNQPSNKSYITAEWNDLPSQEDPFGIEKPYVKYSLNKQQRWEVLDDFRKHIANQSSSSDDEDELGTQSDSEQKRKKKVHHQQKYRLQEFHDINHQQRCVGITTNTGQQRTRKPRKTYMQSTVNKHQNENQPNNNETGSPDVTYYAVVPPPKEKQLTNIRKQHGSKGIYFPLLHTECIILSILIGIKTTGNVQRSKFTQAHSRLNARERLENDRETSSDDEDLMAYVSHLQTMSINIYLFYFLWVDLYYPKTK